MSGAGWARAGLVVVAMALMMSCTADKDPPGRVSETLALTVPRAVHRATVLADGRVLVTGGCTLPGCEGFERAAASELFDADVGTFTRGPEMTTPRAGHTATLLHDGRVLLVGGYDGEGRPALATAEVFDPATNRFRSVGNLSSGRADHTATVMPDGSVLIAGGTSGARDALRSTERYDPKTDTFAAGPPLSSPRSGHAAALADGLLLLAGGTQDFVSAVSSTDVLRQDAWSAGPDMGTARIKHAARGLPDGAVLVIGGSIDTEGRDLLSSTEILNTKDMGIVAGPELSEGQYKLDGAVTDLPDGRVVIAGGQRVEVFDPATRQLTLVNGPAVPRRSFVSASTLPDGSVLVAGGYDARISPTADARVVSVPTP